MVIFSPSNARNPQGTPTLRKACEREYCYCEAPPPNCTIAVNPASPWSQDLGVTPLTYIEVDSLTITTGQLLRWQTLTDAAFDQNKGLHVVVQPGALIVEYDGVQLGLFSFDTSSPFNLVISIHLFPDNASTVVAVQATSTVLLGEGDWVVTPGVDTWARYENTGVGTATISYSRQLGTDDPPTRPAALSLAGCGMCSSDL